MSLLTRKISLTMSTRSRESAVFVLSGHFWSAIVRENFFLWRGSIEQEEKWTNTSSFTHRQRRETYIANESRNAFTGSYSSINHSCSSRLTRFVVYVSWKFIRLSDWRSISVFFLDVKHFLLGVETTSSSQGRSKLSIQIVWRKIYLLTHLLYLCNTT